MYRSKINYFTGVVLIAILFLVQSCFTKSGIKNNVTGVKIVVLGSSTAAGTGPKNIKNAWVNRYRTYLKKQNPQNEVINLAVGGYTTYHLLPTDSKASKNRPAPDPEHNIIKALSLHPDIIIINLPSNDAAYGYSVTEQINNYKLITKPAKDLKIPVFVTTPQGRNMSKEKLEIQFALKDSTYAMFGNRTIDFWNISATSTGNINPVYDSGDGIHLNDAGHKLLFEEVVRKVLLR